MDVRAALIRQYHAAMDMLRQAIVRCPDDMWNEGPYLVPFWQVAYHTLYGTHMYLKPTLEDFVPWELHRTDYNDLPWPPEGAPKLPDPYTRTQILEYWGLVNAQIDDAVSRLDLDMQTSGFPWHEKMPKLDHQIQSVRHIQHHAALLSGRLRLALGSRADVPWVRGEPK